MQITVTEAKGRLTDLVRRAESGEDIVLTRHGHPAVRLVPVAHRADPVRRRAVLEAVRRAAAAKVQPGESASRSQDFLYDEADGLPPR